MAKKEEAKPNDELSIEDRIKQAELSKMLAEEEKIRSEIQENKFNKYFRRTIEILSAAILSFSAYWFVNDQVFSKIRERDNINISLELAKSKQKVKQTEDSLVTARRNFDQVISDLQSVDDQRVIEREKALDSLIAILNSNEQVIAQLRNRVQQIQLNSASDKRELLAELDSIQEAVGSKMQTLESIKKESPGREAFNYADLSQPDFTIDIFSLTSDPTANKIFLGGQPSSQKSVKVLNNVGFSIGYSEELMNPLWAASRFFTPNDGSRFNRPNFYKDKRISVDIDNRYWYGNDWDRGHLLSSSSIGKRYGELAFKQCFAYSAITMQHMNLNRDEWLRLEQYAEEISEKYGEVWVISGPVFSEDSRKYTKDVKVPMLIPDGYFMILAIVENKSVQTLAFIVNQDDETSADQQGKEEVLLRSLTSIKEIESRTQLTFFPDLNQSQRNALVASKANSLW